ncbi:hypothetical protein RB195_015321 [Necator americanus]|uniref:Uncharacterized protein n=1 Tax=Necator americanus TaxID=51031 RepID=A0ABR1E571_NECAM
MQESSQVEGQRSNAEEEESSKKCIASRMSEDCRRLGEVEEKSKRWVIPAIWAVWIHPREVKRVSAIINVTVDLYEQRTMYIMMFIYTWTSPK